MARRSSNANRIFFLALRFLRRPLIVLVSVYGVSMAGWTVIPGPDGAEPMSIFHAFYFLTYTATTTGFGEIPYPFTDLQRMWSIVSLYAGVVAWLYAIGAIIGLFQHPHFRQATAEWRFSRRVAGLNGPFVILCGFGGTGSLLTRGLSDAGLTAVILDKDPDRILAIQLRDYRITVHGLCADARNPDTLIDAGLTKPNCRAIVALTGDEDVNLKISVAAKLLNPKATLIARSTSETHEDMLSTLGGGVHIVDPFKTYARYLSGAVHTPQRHTLYEWLIGAPGARLSEFKTLPEGTWILCGFGRMGRRIREALEALGIDTVVIDPRLTAEGETMDGQVVSQATSDMLVAAGVETAAGIVAGTNDDSINLSILLGVKRMNPNAFIVVRQNDYKNEVLFETAAADMIMQPSLVAARRILFLLIAPLLRNFLVYARERQTRPGDTFIADAVHTLRETVGGTHPRLWTIRVDEAHAPALMALINSGCAVTLGAILRDPSDRDHSLGCVPLVTEQFGEVTVMPDSGTELRPGQQVLFCGTDLAQRELDATLDNPYTLHYLLTGREMMRGVLLRKILSRETETPNPFV